MVVEKEELLDRAKGEVRSYVHDLNEQHFKVMKQFQSGGGSNLDYQDILESAHCAIRLAAQVMSVKELHHD